MFELLWDLWDEFHRALESCTTAEENDCKVGILHLPEVLVYDVLLSWVSVGELGRLDTAFCNRVSRKQFLRFIRSRHFVIRLLYEPREYNSFLLEKNRDRIGEWLLTRGIAVRSLIVTEAFAKNSNRRRYYLKKRMLGPTSQHSW
jgi:hypothetical protein